MMVRGRQDLKIQGPRLNLTKEDKMLVRHGPDRRLEPIITPPMPLMEVNHSYCFMSNFNLKAELEKDRCIHCF